MYLFGALSLLVLASLSLTYSIRYAGCRVWFLWLLAKSQGSGQIRYLTTLDPEQLKTILQSTVKGHFIEYHIATPAWYPIISLE